MLQRTQWTVVIAQALFLLLLTVHVNDVAGQTCPSACQCFGFRLSCEPSLPDGRIPDYIPETTDALTIIANDLRNISAEDLLGLPNLQELQIISRDLEFIEPGAFSPLRNLTILGIYLAGEIMVIDEGLVRGLPRLETLRVEGTSVSRVTEGAIAILPNLRRLYLIADDFTSLPDNFLSGSNITHLDLSSNIMTEISTNAFNSLSSLVELTLAHNTLNVFSGDTFQNLYNLEVLDLSSNNIAFLNASTFEALNSLRVLNLEDNDIPYLPADTFRSLFNLTELSLASNLLSFLPHRIFEDLLSFSILDLTDNRLTTLYRTVFDLDKGIDEVFINLMGNPLHCDCNIEWLQSAMDTTNMICASPAAVANSTLSILNETDFECISTGFIGNRVLLVCPVGSNPDWQTSWLVPGGDFINPDTASELFQVTADGDLLIVTASTREAGEYMCYVIDADRNVVATETVSLELSLRTELTTNRVDITEDRSPSLSSDLNRKTTVEPPEGRRTTLQTQSNSYDAEIVLGAQGTISPNMQYPENFSYIWITPGGIQIQKNESLDRFTVLIDGTLSINPVTESDEGIYRVSVIDLSNVVIASTIVRVSFRESRMTTQQTQTNFFDAEIVIGTQGSISVNLQYPENFNYIWITPGGIQIQKNESFDRFTVLIDGTLSINPVTESDEGIFRVSVIDLSNVVVASRVVRVTFADAISTTVPNESTESATEAENTEALQRTPSSFPIVPTTESDASSRLPISSSSPPVTERRSSTVDSEGIILVDRDRAFLTSPKPTSIVEVIFRWITPDGQILFVNDSSGPYDVSPQGDLRIQPVNDISVGTYVVFVTDMSGFELDFQVFRVLIAPESTTTPETDKSPTYEEDRSTPSSDTVSVSEDMTSGSTASEGITTQQADTPSDTEENVNLINSTTPDPLPPTDANVMDQDSFTVTITSLERVELSPEYTNLQDLNVIWVTPDAMRITKNQTIGPFTVSNDGFLTVEPVLDFLIGVYTAVITDSDGVVLDVNAIRLVFTLPTTQATTVSTTLSFTSSTILFTTDKTTATMPTSIEDTTIASTEGEATTFGTEEETTTVTTTKGVTDRDLFTIILYSRVQAILSPRYPFDLVVNIIWVTPDGERLALNDTRGPYEVRSDGNIVIQPVEATSLGVYTATITTLDNTLIDLNIISVQFIDPSTASPELTTTEVNDSTTTEKTNSTEDTATFSTGMTDSDSSPIMTTESKNEPTDESMRTTELPDEDFFEVILTQRDQAIISPQYFITNSTDYLWVTPDGITLRQGESRGPYNVTIDGQLIIQPITDSRLGTYTVSVTDGRGYLQDLNVIRVQYAEPTTPTLEPSSPTPASDIPTSIPPLSTDAITESSNSTSIQTTLNPLTTDNVSVETTTTRNSTPLLSAEPTESRSTARNDLETTQSTFLPTTPSVPEQLFLRDGQTNVVFPRLPNGINLNVGWVTADGFELSKGDSVGTYSVNNLGQLLISRVSESNEGTFSVLLTDSNDVYIGLYIFRVIVYNATSQEPTQTVVTLTDMSSANRTSMSSAMQTNTNEGTSTRSSDATTITNATTNPELMSTSLFPSSFSSSTPPVDESTDMNTIEAETTEKADTSNRSEQTSTGSHSTVLATSTDATITAVSGNSISIEDMTTHAEMASTRELGLTTPVTSGTTIRILETLATTPTFPTVSTSETKSSSQTESSSNTPVSTLPLLEKTSTGPTGFSTSSSINTISTKIMSTQQPSTSEYIDSSLSSDSSAFPTTGSFAPTTGQLEISLDTSPSVVTKEEFTTGTNMLITTEAQLPDTSSQTSARILTMEEITTGIGSSMMIDDISTDTTTFLSTDSHDASTDLLTGNSDLKTTMSSTTMESPLDLTTARQPRTVSRQRTERIPTSRMSTPAGTEPRPAYLIPLAVGIALAGIAFLLILISMCLALTKNHKEDYGVHIIEEEKARKGELIPIEDTDDEPKGLDNHGNGGIAENGTSNAYTLEPGNNGASESRIVSMVGNDGVGYDTIYFVDGSVHGANNVPTDDGVFY